METNLLTIEEVAQRFQVSKRTVMRLSDSGELASIRVGSRRRWRQADLQDFIDRQANTAAPEVAA